ncbi:hypothetical protein LTR60_006144 [Cryomyces antarcticus]|nr:hypothetical protein LTR60_006144 [Cryomyces antarcticus]
MAILEDVPGIEVAITVNGNDLKEYEEDDIVNEPKTVTKYIEATSGVNFGIRYSVARRFPMKGDCITFSMYLDNEKCGSSVVTKASVNTSSSQHCKYGRNEADSKLRRFMFAALETGSSDELRIEEDNARVQKIGTMEVRVYHKRIISRFVRPRQPEFARIGILPEKALKGQTISHNIR